MGMRGWRNGPRKILVVGPGGRRVVLTEVEAHDEAQLQQCLTENPDLIPIEEFGWSAPLMVVGRETSLASGAPDLVGIAPGGEILVAEFKTGPKNPDFRAALSQAIDYGADMWQMSFDEFEAAVAVRYFNSPYCPTDSPCHGAKSLMEAAEATWGDDWDNEDRSQFGDRVEAALGQGSFLYAVVAQRFTPAMERTARYLNATGRSFRVALVELIRFASESEDIEAFEARTVVKPPPDSGPGGTGDRKPPVDPDSFFPPRLTIVAGRSWMTSFRSALAWV